MQTSNNINSNSSDINLSNSSAESPVPVNKNMDDLIYELIIEDKSTVTNTITTTDLNEKILELSKKHDILQVQMNTAIKTIKRLKKLRNAVKVGYIALIISALALIIVTILTIFEVKIQKNILSLTYSIEHGKNISVKTLSTPTIPNFASPPDTSNLNAHNNNSKNLLRPNVSKNQAEIWIISLGSFATEFAANEKAIEYKNKGILVEIDLIQSGEKNWYRIISKPFKTRKKAAIYAAYIKNKLDIGTVLVTSKTP